MKASNLISLLGLVAICIFGASPSSQAESVTDRSKLSLEQALAGHWFLQQYNKHEYYELVAASPQNSSTKNPGSHVKMTWESGKDKSDGAIPMFFHAFNEKENFLILTYKSKDGEFQYWNKFTFNSSRTQATVQSLDKSMQPKYSPHSIVYVDMKQRASSVE